MTPAQRRAAQGRRASVTKSAREIADAMKAAGKVPPWYATADAPPRLLREPETYSSSEDDEGRPKVPVLREPPPGAGGASAKW